MEKAALTWPIIVTGRRDCMDYLQGMNQVVAYIEENLTEQIRHETLARMVGCSVYEFSRIFSFLAEMSVSEYIRRRRLSQAVFDLQHSDEKIVDIALKYCYESPTTFTRAFKELHGATPSSVRKESIPLKTYPPITFHLTIKGGTAMEFRIEKRESFQIMGLSGYDTAECAPGETLTPLWREFMDHYNPRLWNGGGTASYYTAPFWQVGAYQFQSQDGKTRTIIGAQYRGEAPEGMAIETIPAATWAVFPVVSPAGIDHVPAAYTRILTEWFPASGYRRDTSVPNLEVFPAGNASSAEYTWEIWIPVVSRE